MIATRPARTRPHIQDSLYPSALVTAALLTLGLMALVTGIGVGLRWLRAGVISWESLLAMMCLLGGAFGVVVGVGRIGREVRPWARVAMRGAVVLLLALSTWTLVPALVATFVPPLGRGDSPGGFGLATRDVRFESEDGVVLAGWYVPAENGRTVIIRHGSGSTAADVWSQALVLVGSGYGVLVTDARGHGLSGGRAMDFGWHGDRDIEAAMNFLFAQPEVDPSRVGVMGMSMGGEEAIGAAGSDLRIAAVVAEGATARTESDKAWLADVYGWRGQVQTWLEWVQYSFADLLTSADKPLSLREAAARADPTPILLITAGEVPDETNAATYIQGSGDNVTVWTVPGAGHVQGLKVDPVGWERMVIGFLDGAMR